MFLITLKQVGILLFYIFCGYTLVKIKLLKRDISKGIATLLTFFISPLYSIVTLSKNVSIEKLTTYLLLVLSGVIFTLIMVSISLLISRFFSKDKKELGIYRYMLAFGNVGYFGYPLIDAVFGNAILAQYMMFVLPINICIYSFGYYILTKTTIERNDSLGGIAKRSLLSPPMIGTWIGLLLGLLPISLPSIIYEFITPASNCFSVLAMMLVGIVLAGLDFKSLFTEKKSYFVALIKLLIYPVVFLVISLILNTIGVPKEIIVAIVATSALPSGMNVVVYPESVGNDSSIGARACFISYIVSLASVPTVFYIMTLLF